jgi:hypothetical protein
MLSFATSVIYRAVLVGILAVYETPPAKFPLGVVLPDMFMALGAAHEHSATTMMHTLPAVFKLFILKKAGKIKY